jgi:hypothetical protein
VHSKFIEQKVNEHWEVRANDRGGLDVNDPFLREALLKELKEELNTGGDNVRAS